MSLTTDIQALNWGTDAPEIEIVPEPVADPSGLGDIDVAVPGARTRVREVKKERPHTSSGAAGGARARRRGRGAPPDILARESAPVQALFEKMWKDNGIALARSVGRARVSKADAAIGWYTLLLAMRARDGK
jgi:hypothetical protein